MIISALLIGFWGSGKIIKLAYHESKEPTSNIFSLGTPKEIRVAIFVMKSANVQSTLHTTRAEAAVLPVSSQPFQIIIFSSFEREGVHCE